VIKINKEALKRLKHKTEEVVQKEKVLLIEDELPNLKLLSRILAQKYEVLTATDGLEAIDSLSEPGISVIVSDQRMPKMSGVEFFCEAERMQHPAVRIILTGYADLDSVVQAVNGGRIFRYLTKPIDSEELLQTVKQASDHYNVQKANLQLVTMVKDTIEQNAQLTKRLMQYEQVDKNNLDNSKIFLHEPQKIPLVIMMMDIRGFTQFASVTSPFKVMDILQNIYKSIHEIIYDYGGFVDKHMGDGLMAVFGLAGEGGIMAGVNCMKKIVSTSPKIMKSVGEGLKVGIGLAAGELVVGMLGTSKRSEMAIIGQPANLSSRLEEFTKYALLNETVKSLTGEFNYAMGISLPELTSSSNDYIDIDLPDGIIVRDFAEIRKISMIKE